jgi:hypothetical protein
MAKASIELALKGLRLSGSLDILTLTSFFVLEVFFLLSDEELLLQPISKVVVSKNREAQLRIKILLMLV